MSYMCTLCGTVASAETLPREDAQTVSCMICGEYEIDGNARNAFKDYAWGKPDQRFLLSAMTKTAPVRGVGRVRVTIELLGRASRGELREPGFKEKRAAMLEWIEHESRRNGFSQYGATVSLNPMRDYPVAWCRDTRPSTVSEWTFVFKPLVQEGLLLDLGTNQVQLTNKGWEYLESRPKATGAQAFVAMAFRPDLADTYAALSSGIKAAGYKALRIDKHEFSGGVMDEILAQIRQSKLLVADLTYNRGGVYREEGFALGLGLPTIHTCRADHVDGSPELRVHFDVQHLNLILWTPENLDELAKRVQSRIEAVLGKGPV